jgi:DNA-binding GntR family transcriptional regulator
VADRFLTKEELVARHLREQIVSGRLKPGSRIRQQRLASELGFSQTPVREAVRSLVSEGWLVSLPHVGASVAETNFEGLDEIYSVRIMLEGYLAAEAAKRMTGDVLDQLTRLNLEFSRVANGADYQLGRAINYQLHQLIWETAQCRITLGFVNSLWAKFPWDSLGAVPGRGNRTVHEHDDIIAALAAKDSDRARGAAAAHIASGRNDMQKRPEQKTTVSGG